MKNYKLIVSDLDGTLLKNDMTVSRENEAAIQRLSEDGIVFSVSSGRTFSEIPQCVRDNPHIRYIAYSNGTAIYDKELHRNVVANGISPKSAENALKILAEYETVTAVHCDGCAYFNGAYANDGTLEYYNINDYFKSIMLAMTMTDDVTLKVKNAEVVEALVIFFHSDGELEECKTRLDELEGIKVTSSTAHNLELCSDKAGKGAALGELSSLLGIDGDGIIAIGDNENDVSMFEMARLGLAVGNASELTRELADEIICTNEEHIIEYVEKHYIKDVAESKPKLSRRKKTVAAICSAAVIIAAVIISFAIRSGSYSATRVMYFGSHTWSSWSGSYEKLDGKMKHTIRPSGDEVKIAVTTVEGEIAIEILNDEGDTVFEKSNIGTEEFTVNAEGKLRIVITAKNHKGSFVIG